MTRLQKAKTLIVGLVWGEVLPAYPVPVYEGIEYQHYIIAFDLAVERRQMKEQEWLKSRLPKTITS